MKHHKKEDWNKIVLIVVAVVIVIIGISLWAFGRHAVPSTDAPAVDAVSVVKSFPPETAPDLFPADFQLNGVLGYLNSQTIAVSNGTIEASRTFSSSIEPKKEYQFYAEYLPTNGWTLQEGIATSTGNLYSLNAIKGSSSILIQIADSQISGKTLVSVGFFLPKP